MKRKVLNVIELEFGLNLEESPLIPHTHQHKKGHQLIRSLGECVGHAECSVIGLDDLVDKGEILSDEDVEVGIDLMHIKVISP